MLAAHAHLAEAGDRRRQAGCGCRGSVRLAGIRGRSPGSGMSLIWGVVGSGLSPECGQVVVSGVGQGPLTGVEVAALVSSLWARVWRPAVVPSRKCLVRVEMTLNFLRAPPRFPD